MKMYIAIAILCASTVHASDIYQGMNPVEKSSFNSTIITAATSYSPSVSSGALSGTNRGVADIEQLQDELPALELDLQEGLVSEMADVRQPTLREWFGEIVADDAAMNQLRAANPAMADLQIVVEFARHTLN